MKIKEIGQNELKTMFFNFNLLQKLRNHFVFVVFLTANESTLREYCSSETIASSPESILTRHMESRVSKGIILTFMWGFWTLFSHTLALLI